MSSNNGKPCAYIHDGMTRRAYLSEAPNLYPAVRFTYRPTLSQDRAQIFGAIAKADDRKAETLSAETIRSRVIEWDIVDHKGAPVRLDTSEILRLQPRLLNRIFLVVVGNEGGDDDPGTSDGERNGQAEAELSAALAGTTPEDHLAKNSPTASV